MKFRGSRRTALGYANEFKPDEKVPPRNSESLQQASFRADSRPQSGNQRNRSAQTRSKKAERDNAQIPEANPHYPQTFHNPTWSPANTNSPQHRLWRPCVSPRDTSRNGSIEPRVIVICFSTRAIQSTLDIRTQYFNQQLSTRSRATPLSRGLT